MVKLLVALTLCSVVFLAMPFVHGIDEDPLAVEKWFKNLPNMKEKITKLHFYFHDIVSGTSPTAYRIVQPKITSTSPTHFGFVNMADDKLTAGPEPDSKTVGRAQGIFGSAALVDESLLMTLNLYFTEGIYNGSTLSLFGRNPLFHKYREMSIVGGTGVFRLARGIATAKTYLFNLTSDNAIVEYHVIVVHYS